MHDEARLNKEVGSCLVINNGNRVLNELVRDTGIEPVAPAWKAGVLAVIRIPHEATLLYQIYSSKTDENMLNC